MTYRLPHSYTMDDQTKAAMAAARAARNKVRKQSPEYKAQKRAYDQAHRDAYAARKKELEASPARQAVRTGYLRARRTAPQIALSLLIANAKYRAKKNGVEFSITASDVSMPSICPVLGINIEHGNQDGKLTARDCAPSLDRHDNAKGYVVGNVRVISWRANRLKSDATSRELRAIIAYMEGGVL